VTCETAGDFLKASIAFSRNRFGLHFKTAVRIYLRLPVTASVLYTGTNSSRAIDPDGEGASRAANTRRHIGLKNDVNSLVAFLGKTLGMEVIYEARMRDYVVLPPPGLPLRGAVLIFHDIYGLDSGRTRHVADQIASWGYLVIMPDFFRDGNK
jgi:hypothetical protein